VQISNVVLICFAGIVASCVAGFMVFRDLFGRDPRARRRVVSAKELRRARTVFDEEPADSVTGRLDQAFDCLVLETGFGMTPTTAFLMILACGLGIGGVCFLYFDNLAISLIGIAVGMVTPIGVMMFYRSRRMRQMHETLPILLDLLARAVRAGQSIDQAIAFVGEETRGPLGQEFSLASKQIDMGLSISAVMQSLAKRVRLMEIRMLGSTLLVHRQAGGNLPTTLERMSQVVKGRLNYRRQMRAATGAGRSSTVLIAVIAPLLYVIMFMWQPQHVQVLLDDPIGQGMLMAAVLLEVVGILWVSRLLKTDY